MTSSTLTQLYLAQVLLCCDRTIHIKLKPVPLVNKPLVWLLSLLLSTLFSSMPEITKTTTTATTQFRITNIVVVVDITW